MPHKFCKERLSTISRVETVLSFNHGDERTKKTQERPSDEGYQKLQKEVRKLQEKLDEVELIHL